MRVGNLLSKPRASGNAGFTITELLVVMVIIGILAALIFPVVMKAKESARISQCLSNMRQLGTGLSLYMDNFDSRFPSAVSWGCPSYWAQPQLGSQKTIQEVLTPYVRNGMTADADGRYSKPSVFVCPSDTGIPGNIMVNGVPPNKPIWRYAGCSYEYYACDQIDWPNYNPKNPLTKHRQPWTGLSPEFVEGYVLQRVGAPLAKVVAPTRKAVMGDTWYWHPGDRALNAQYTDVPGSQEGLLAYRNTLYADGHAQRVNGWAHEQARVQPLMQWHSASLSEVPEE